MVGTLFPGFRIGDVMMLSVRGNAAVQVLASPAFAAVPYAARYDALAERLKLDFSAIIFSLSHLPLGLRGLEHAAQRADVARLMAERRGALAAALPGIVARSFACLNVPGEHEVMAAAIVPCVDAVIGEMVGMPPDLAADSLVSRVFSQKIGVAQRRRLEGELARLIARLVEAFPGESDERIGSRLTLVVLGRDSLFGTLGNSLRALFDQADGRALSGFRLAVPPSHTGVPYIDREAVADTAVSGRLVENGTVVRCMLDSLEGADDAARLRFFGHGAHLCLGRAAALDLFGVLAEHLAGLSARVRVLEVVPRDCDVFSIPDKFIIEVEA